MKFMTRLLGLGMIMLTTTSCLSTFMPPEDPAKRAALEAKFTPRSETYASKGAFKKAPAWEVGQFIVTGTSENGRPVSVVRTAIVGREADGYILEMTTEDARSRAGQQLLVKGLDKVAQGKGDPEAVEILWIRMMDEKGQVQKIEGAMLGVMAMPMRSNLQKMFQADSSTQKSDGGTVQVPAGTFKGTTRIDSEVRVMGMTFRSTGHLHPAVPINGMVRSESEDGKSVSELLDFGLSGATASF